MGILSFCLRALDVRLIARLLFDHLSLIRTPRRYSTMDNVDGKQARRTGTSSPLGELFEYVILLIARKSQLLTRG